MDKDWIRLRRDLIAPCFTCPICDSLLKEATGNTECSHTFCKDCIYFMIEEEETESCPVCETDWTSNPEYKLRPDFNWQCLRDTVFPSEQSTTKGKEKEKSPSPLAVSSPSVAKDHQASSVSIKKEELLEDGSSSNVDHTANNSAENTEETAEKIGLLSLTSSDKALSPFEDNKSTDQGEKKDADAEPQEATLSTLKRMKGKESGSQVQEDKSKGKKGKRKLKDKKNGNDNDSSDTAESNKLGPCKKKAPVSGGSSRSPDQEVLDASNTKLLRDDSIWFSLIADENQEGAPPLPQIPSPYLRIKDGSATVSFIQKYLKQKLGLKSEDEIEIKCMGNSVQPTIVVQDLHRSRMETMFAGQRITVTMGSSAKDFIMVLTYGRKILNP